ncbi:hypothetical protein N657DRAFT_153271 [Parathielavia appendiculata]|uniref:Uncharacterized protein n=1 Tax=Parathielavia appendiculata TaxID=2587402 RepID=A0AAN6TU03_9PEZI|nr:hypothetical protein N657DRAFT_153271 [Parathielavia appendiculata]
MWQLHPPHCRATVTRVNSGPSFGFYCGPGQQQQWAQLARPRPFIVIGTSRGFGIPTRRCHHQLVAFLLTAAVCSSKLSLKRLLYIP